MGNLNGSLFATEGIASVGPIFAPLSALVCGLILSIGNSVSAHLPKRLVATSAGVAMQVLVNVPLSASLLSNGLLLLFLLWYVTPAETGPSSRAAVTRDHEYCITPSSTLPKRSETMSSA